MEEFCEEHSHSTDKGDNVECVACEKARLKEEDKTFTVPVKFVFEGKFFIKAGSQEEAERIVKEDCAMTHRGVHTSVCDDTVTWDFPVHSEKIVGGDDA